MFPCRAAIAVLLICWASPAQAQEKWNLDDPEIAAATFGLLTPMTADGFCPGLSLNRPRIMELLKVQKVQPENVRELCQNCYDAGLKGVESLIHTKGKSAYCDMMNIDFGPDGKFFPGLVESK